MASHGLLGRIGAAAIAVFAGAQAWAAQPVNGGIDLQEPATKVMADIKDFHVLLLWIIIPITILVLALLLWVIVRYNWAANPVPKKFSHNTLIEVIWTAVPVLILVVIATFSFPLLAEEEKTPPADITVKAIGNSWFWTYDYPDFGVEGIVSNMLDPAEAEAQGRPKLLAVDAPIVVPVGTTVRVLVTSNDVIHSWAMPAFGVKEDAIPGRVNEGWFKVDREGTFYGQCSELCGIRHAFMPIEVRAVSREDFEKWIVEQGGTIASAEAPSEQKTGAATPPAATMLQ
jgi:cytochrome c oxidase subunit 2